MPTKPCRSAEDLSLAYTPGVAKPVLRIAERAEDAYRYTAKGNLVAVITNGTAILGLGDRGALAAKPVMEGKGVLFKRFADIDVFDIEIDEKDPGKLIEIIASLSPTFGGINLEDIKGPECFRIERELIERCPIPVFHDDQHGTAIIATAGLMNAAEITGRKLEDTKVVVNGAGAAGISCARMFMAAGVRKENLVMVDSKGVIYRGRPGLTEEKAELAADTDKRTLAEAVEGADVFMGVSVAGALTKEMVASMNRGAVVFAMANPNPEIHPMDAKAAGAAVVGTGRSDFPNQVNNVLGFPGIFRGALDVRATDINEAMKLAASRALAEIASEPIPEDILAILKEAYPADAAAGVFDGENPLKDTYVIPKPFDPRVVPRVAAGVAEAAMKSGVAQVEIKDLKAYEQSVAERIRRANQ